MSKMSFLHGASSLGSEARHQRAHSTSSSPVPGPADSGSDRLLPDWLLLDRRQLLLDRLLPNRHRLLLDGLLPDRR